MSLLVEYGAHIDIKHKSSSFKSYTSHSLFKFYMENCINPVKYMTLGCWCQLAIRQHNIKIPSSMVLPDPVSKFLHLHGWLYLLDFTFVQFQHWSMIYIYINISSRLYYLVIKTELAAVRVLVKRINPQMHFYLKNITFPHVYYEFLSWKSLVTDYLYHHKPLVFQRDVIAFSPILANITLVHWHDS